MFRLLDLAAICAGRRNESSLWSKKVSIAPQHSDTPVVASFPNDTRTMLPSRQSGMKMCISYSGPRSADTQLRGKLKPASQLSPYFQAAT